MKRIVLWFFSTLTAVVLLFGYHTSLSPTSSTTQAAIAPAPASAASTEDTADVTGATNYTGDAVDTRFGPVQVQISVANGKISNVQVLQYPYRDRRDQEINNEALPILIEETVKGQSANIDMVSGATITSDAYLESLQSAIDQAHLA